MIEPACKVNLLHSLFISLKGGKRLADTLYFFQAAMEAEYAALRLAPNSREVELRLRQLKDEAAALQ